MRISEFRKIPFPLCHPMKLGFLTECLPRTQGAKFCNAMVATNLVCEGATGQRGNENAWFYSRCCERPDRLSPWHFQQVVGLQLWAVATLCLSAPSGRRKCLGVDSGEQPSPCDCRGGGDTPLRQARCVVECWLSEHRSNEARLVCSAHLPDNSPSIGHLPSPVSLVPCPASVF